MNEIIKPGLTLFLVTVIAAACLGAVYGITKEPIERQQLLTRNAAMRELIPEADEFVEMELPAGGAAGVTSCFEALSGGAPAGYIIGVSPVGYAGEINTMAALGPDGTILGIDIVKHSETAGLGANADKPEFTGRFIGKRGALTVTKGEAGDGEIQAITSATVTTRAVTDGVNAATAFFEAHLRGGGK